MRVKWRDFGAGIVLCLFLLTASIALVIVLTPIYSLYAQLTGLAEQLGMDHARLMHNYHQLMAYLKFPSVEKLVMDDFVSSGQGLFHFYEVKKLFIANDLVLAFSAFFSFIAWRWIHRHHHWQEMARFFKWALFFPFILVFLLLINFDWMFVLFHQILFNNQAWIFNPATDPIILALPQGFFMLCFALVFIMIELGLAFLYFYFKNKSSKQRELA